LKLINTGFLTPSEMAKWLGISISQTSRTLKELLENELVTCNTPDRNKGKIYRITDTGRSLLDLIGGKNG
jgi:DNA-binding MarR family transcriptional regulator